MTKEEKIDSLKNKISMALKDTVLQIGFEVICKQIEDLKAYNEKLLNGDIEKHNKIVALESQLNKAKDIINKLILLSRKEWVYSDVREEAEKFLEE